MYAYILKEHPLKKEKNKQNLGQYSINVLSWLEILVILVS